MVELLAGLVSNILLLTLLVKARRFQNYDKCLPWFHGCQQPAVYVPCINFTGIVCDQVVGVRTDHVYIGPGYCECADNYATPVHQWGEIQSSCSIL